MYVHRFQDLRFKREGMDALESFKSITATNSGWTTEKTDVRCNSAWRPSALNLQALRYSQL